MHSKKGRALIFRCQNRYRAEFRDFAWNIILGFFWRYTRSLLKLVGLFQDLAGKTSEHLKELAVLHSKMKDVAAKVLEAQEACECSVCLENQAEILRSQCPTLISIYD